MTTSGWLFMLSSVSFVWLLAGYCYYKVLCPSGRHSGQAPSEDGPSGEERS